MLSGRSLRIVALIGAALVTGELKARMSIVGGVHVGIRPGPNGTVTIGPVTAGMPKSLVLAKPLISWGDF